LSRENRGGVKKDCKMLTGLNTGGVRADAGAEAASGLRQGTREAAPAPSGKGSDDWRELGPAKTSHRVRRVGKKMGAGVAGA